MFRIFCSLFSAKWQSKLLVIITIISIVTFIPTLRGGATAHPQGNGILSLYSYHTGDVLDITFRTDKGYDKSALEKINYVLRSRGDDKIHPISIELIDLIDNIQDHFGIETVEIISGYRSSAFNDYLIKEGRGAASESLHTTGMAADIHIDEITEKALWEYVKSLGAGGAGYYPDYNFVHVDVGPRRTWQEPPRPQRNLVGIENSPNKGWAVLTDKNIYYPGETISFTITNELMERSALVKNLWSQRFRKGIWGEQAIINKSKQAAKLDAGQSYTHTWEPADIKPGKYRIVVFPSRNFTTPPAFSNEFYIKKR